MSAAEIVREALEELAQAGQLTDDPSAPHEKRNAYWVGRLEGTLLTLEWMIENAPERRDVCGLTA